MIGRRAFAGVVLGGAAALAVGGCAGEEARSYNYRLTVEVETPKGIRKGCSVIAIQGFRLLKGTEVLGGNGPRARGEAVAVDLPNGQTLFALLRSETDVDWAGSAHIGANPKKPDSFASTDDYYQAVGRDREAYPVQRWIELTGRPPRDNYPLLVMFKDISNPASVVRVNPDDLAASFGTGYRLKMMTVQGTDEPMSKGIEKRLGWLSQSDDGGLDPTMGVTAKPTFAQQLGFFDFRRK